MPDCRTCPYAVKRGANPLPWVECDLTGCQVVLEEDNDKRLCPLSLQPRHEPDLALAAIVEAWHRHKLGELLSNYSPEDRAELQELLTRYALELQLAAKEANR